MAPGGHRGEPICAMLVWVMEIQEARLAEYESLREEILQRQQARLWILGFTVATLGLMLGIAAGVSLSKDSPRLWVGLLYVAQLILAASIAMTIHQTRAIDLLAGYLRAFVEPNTGLAWETSWQNYRKSQPRRGSQLPLGTSKLLAAYYLALQLGLALVGVSIGVHKTGWSIGLALLALATILGIYDLYARQTPGWRVERKLGGSYVQPPQRGDAQTEMP
jgi:hypothetical protein